MTSELITVIQASDAPQERYNNVLIQPSNKLSQSGHRFGDAALEDAIKLFTRQTVCHGFVHENRDMEEFMTSFVNVDKASHDVENIRLEPEGLVGDIVIRESPAGSHLKHLLTDLDISFRIRGLVQTLPNVPDVLKVQIISFDAVCLD